jgi:RNA polymerase sigma-70 factor (ECF subfamily)
MTEFPTEYQHCSDESLMDAIKQGRILAFDALYQRYSKRLLRYFHRMLGNDADKAQDFLQEIFLKIVERPGLFHTDARFSTWIYTVAHNMCKNEYRRLKVRKLFVGGMAPHSNHGTAAEDGGLEQELFQKEFMALLWRELGKIEEAKRSAFLLRFQEGFSIKEIAEIVRCSEGTVKSRLFYTIKQLTARLAGCHPSREECGRPNKNNRVPTKLKNGAFQATQNEN